MKRFLSLLAISAIATFTFIGLSKPAPTYAEHGWKVLSVKCVTGTINITIFVIPIKTSVDPDISVNGVYLKTVGDYNAGGANGLDDTYTFSDSDPAYVLGAVVTAEDSDGGWVGGPSSASATCTAPKPALTSTNSVGGYFGPLYYDNRLNDKDGDESVAIYCEVDGSVKVLALYNQKGVAAFIATPAEIATVPKSPTINTVIKSGNGATLYRLTSGELQVNRTEDNGKMYHFIFKDCPRLK
jgi:hypothetical protein